ncbi:Translation initiation factor 2, alpha subunit, middle domain-containing protein [Rozella allomycis CSF55]|uniref:Translation initiation factor 2, alpha subunit, middle domain-containing protein n=1 Tax=Rozella allomycis (strain CSF55) TaxID=988480 RepID=A0A075AVS7_ROZAC|nr:Translation initiation factor 2, alpha subunit, middle domain-containing protein [Rozella allomycis CSF55]|eukprot:EPZ32822.1 Translation initiation factor 2, alpha subunit, middle domain-containing protein [Rozella allomycis CSF55]
MVNVRQIADMGAYVQLLEYNNIEGMILHSELSRRRIRSIQKLIRVGKNEAVVVLRVDKEKGYIDLSKRRVSPEDIKKCEERYGKSKVVNSIVRMISEKRGIPMEDLNAKFIWPLYKQFGHAYDAFKAALNDAEGVFKNVDITEDLKNELMTIIQRRLAPQKVKFRADFEVQCAGFEGINAVKEALIAGEKCGTEDTPLKIRLVAPPLYIMTTSSMERQSTVELMEHSLKVIGDIIEKKMGKLDVKTKPRAMDDSDDLEIAAMMEQAERENAQVSGDEESSGLDGE